MGGGGGGEGEMANVARENLAVVMGVRDRGGGMGEKGRAVEVKVCAPLCGERRDLAELAADALRGDLAH